MNESEDGDNDTRSVPAVLVARLQFGNNIV